jgi:amino acid transporter
MATTFPENSGYVALVTAAFGPFCGFLEGFFSWLSGVADNSVYPVLLADNLAVAWPALGVAGSSAGAVPWIRTAFVLGTSAALTLMSYRGLQVVGRTAAVTTALVVVPFALLCGLALPRADPSRWLVVDWPSVQWGTYLNVMFWNLNYWDSVSCLAGEVDDPASTFPRALMIAVVLVVALYFFPTLAALGLPPGVAPPADAWALGDYGRVALAVPGGGKWLAAWILVAAAASQVGQYQAEMASDAYQLQGMAERGFLPLFLARRSRFGTPTWGIALSCMGVAWLSSFSFVGIISALNAVYCLAELLEFAAFVYLRARAPALPRPYRVPLSTVGVALMLLPASALLLTILALPWIERDWTTLAASGGALLAGCALYPALQLAKERGWLAFADLRFEYEHHVAAGTPASGGEGVAGATEEEEEVVVEGAGRADVERGLREPLLAGGAEDGKAAAAPAPQRGGGRGRRTMLSPVIPESPGQSAELAEEAARQQEQEEEKEEQAEEQQPQQPLETRRSGSWSIRATGDHAHWQGDDEYDSRRVDEVDYDAAHGRTTTRRTFSRRRSGGSVGSPAPSSSSFGARHAPPPPGPPARPQAEAAAPAEEEATSSSSARKR